MVNTPALFDTCILIDYLRGVVEARLECDGYSDRSISIVSWMEIMAGATPANEGDTQAFLLNFAVLPLDADVAIAACHIRRQRRMSMSSAIVLATAATSGRILLTRNTRDFPANTPGVRVPYEI
jgi:hypothetical protein